MKKTLTQFTLLLLIFTVVACKKFLNLQPIDSPTENDFYADEKGLQGGLVSCYDGMQSSSLYGDNILVMGENRSDNIIDTDPNAGAGVAYQIDVFTDKSDNILVKNTYLQTYATIFRCNSILDRAPLISMNATTKNQVIGQALFIRSLMYFNGVRFWGKLPLIIRAQTGDETRNNHRSEVSEIYAQIVSDLTMAVSYLPNTWPADQRGRASRYAAMALLGKVYLYQKQYDLVVSTLTPLVNAIYDGSDIALVPQPNTFPNGLKTSKDILFAVQYLLGGLGESVHQNNRYRNLANIQITVPPSLFENGDNRKALVAPPAYSARPGKFNGEQVNQETSMDMPIIRCAEVLLIYAEALNEISFPNTNAFKAINAVRTNAAINTLNPTATPTQADLRNAIYKERRLELVLECDRWFDINRLNLLQTLFPLVQPFKKYYAIPQQEINNMNDKSGWQNDGY